MDMHMGENMLHNTESLNGHHEPILQNDDWTYNSTYPSLSAQTSAFWLTSNSAYIQPTQQQRNSTSTRSSLASNSRTSAHDSVFSQFQGRASVVSMDSNLSYVFEGPYDQSSLAPFEGLQQQMQKNYVSDSIESPVSPVPSASRRRSVQRNVTPERDAFATCVSRRRRSRRVYGEQREPRYWCTSCQEPFQEKFDWKRHEETYQERCFAFRCNLCSAVYFLEKDFLHHHKTRHNCKTCHLGEHLEAAKQRRRTRTGWGCGFCIHFSSDWRERCNHIAQHFEKDFKTMSDWRQSNVIHSLLQRPAIWVAWCKRVQSQSQLWAMVFDWDQDITGRVEGFPENNAMPHLQDMLEYYRSNEDAAALAQLALETITFPSCPPPAPRKDYKEHHHTNLQSLKDDYVSWARFTSTILPDDLQPTNVCQLDMDIANDLFGGSM